MSDPCTRDPDAYGIRACSLTGTMHHGKLNMKAVSFRESGLQYVPMEGVMESTEVKRAICLLMGFLLGALLDRAYAASTDYPNRAVTMIVPYPRAG